MERFRILVLVLAGLGFLGFGAWFIVDPIGPLAAIGIGVSGDPAATELRAFYGGVQVAIALLMLVAATKPAWRDAGLWLVLAVNAGIAVARLLGVAIDGVWVPFFTYALIWELGFSALAAAGLFPGRAAGSDRQ